MIWLWIMHGAVAGLGNTKEEAQQKAGDHAAKMHEVLFRETGFTHEPLKAENLKGYPVCIDLLEIPKDENPEPVVRAQLEPIRLYSS